MILLIFMLKKSIVGAHLNRLAEAVLKDPQSVFWMEKGVNPCIPQFYYIKVGFKGVYIPWIHFPDNCPQPPLYIFFQFNVPFKVISAHMRRVNQ